MKKFARVMASTIVVLMTLMLLVGCGKEKPPRPNPWQDRSAQTGTKDTKSSKGGQKLTKNDNGLPSFKTTEKTKVTKTSWWRSLDKHARKLARSAQYFVAWILLAMGIVIPGPLVIFLVPGVLVGRMEKVLEGIGICAWGIFMLGLVGEAGVDSLTAWVWICLVVPGALLFLWGCFTGNEAGKFVLILGPTTVFGLYVFSQFYRLLVLGAVSSAFFTFLLIAAFVAILYGIGSKLVGASAQTNATQQAT